MDPDLDLYPNLHCPKMLDLDPQRGQCGSTTLTKTIAKVSRSEKDNQIIIGVHQLTEDGRAGGILGWVFTVYGICAFVRVEAKFNRCAVHQVQQVQSNVGST